jgi:transcriptional regulator with XRE-family HTH domain
LRLGSGLTQAELAQAVGLSANHLGVLERGEKVPTLETVEAVAKALGVPVTELLAEETTEDAWVRQLTTIAAGVPPSLRPLVLAVVSTMARHQIDRARRSSSRPSP